VCAPYFVNLNNNTFQLKMLLFIYVHSKKEQKKSSPIINLQCCHFDIVILRLAIISDVQDVRLQHRHRPTDNASTHPAWTCIAGCSFKGPVVRSRFRKSSAPRLLHFLFGNSLINRLTPYLLTPRHFYQYLVFFS